MERDVRAGGVAILRQDDLGEQQMIRAESGIDGGESRERSNEEAGADDQQRGERDLKSDDGLPTTLVRFDAVGDLGARKAASAGANPNSTPVTIVIGAVKPKTCQSKCGVSTLRDGVSRPT